ncbi:SDR family oxidoreductase [Bacillus sp. JJ1503]|uniref:SDR family NAD(P)-dependent oxidoreductase n=1 Tax=unclassified Bacillus (in: firmicutes) TaxID=185979 RepID=UPI003000A7A8
MESQTVPCNSVAIVTGGTSGLGLAVVQRFLEKGKTVAILDISQERGEALEKSLREEGKDVYFFSADVANQENVKQVVGEIYKTLGRIDFLVNAAGINRRNEAVDVSDEELKSVMEINLNGTVYMCQAVQPYLVQEGGGSIVNFASVLAHYGGKYLISYSASKGAVIQATQCLAVEWAEHNIRVNAVCPGYVKTPISGTWKDPMFHERVVTRTPQRRFGEPEEIAAVVDFLCSSDASYITGAAIPVDGGLLAGDPELTARLQL